ncbi:MAG: L-histidine N(alpha)-methyltransferase [Planctomycetes bacterium]|nr:L-histidine N(alpha)-methyltransferase [Planctomycetota bacterium]
MPDDLRQATSRDRPRATTSVGPNVAPERGAETFLSAVLQGLARNPRSISPKWFYDTRGAHLFEKICELDEYYVTRTELEIFDSCLPEIADIVGPGCVVFEPGSGEGIKTELLLDALDAPRGYVPIDVAERQLQRTSEKLRSRFPNLEVRPCLADFGRLTKLPEFTPAASRRLAFFPGSTLGNFIPDAATAFVRKLGDLAGDDGFLVLGVDLVKDTRILERAYDDKDGVTAAFNLNLLRRMQTELGADLDVDAWNHRAIFDAAESRIEMHLVSARDQTIRIGSQRFAFTAGEHIVTEYSYKYSTERLDALVRAAGFEVVRSWTDDREWFRVLLLHRD